MTSVMMIMLLMARANGLIVPDVCWCILFVHFILTLFVAVFKSDKG